MAPPWRAVVGVELEEGLRLLSGACGESSFGEKSGHVIRLRRELIEAQLFAHLLSYPLFRVLRHHTLSSSIYPSEVAKQALRLFASIPLIQRREKHRSRERKSAIT